jgi:two-component system, response regulator, stage 0 sporulation protein F
LADLDLIRRINVKTKIYVLVAEAQEGELAASEMSDLASALASNDEERQAITEAVLGKLVLVKMPSGRIEDLRNAFEVGSLGAAVVAPPTPGSGVRRSTTIATPATPAAEEQFDKGSASQQTRAVKPAFKVPFEARPGQQPAQVPAPPPPPPPPPPEEQQPVEAVEATAAADQTPPAGEPAVAPGESEGEAEYDEVMDTGQFDSDWADLTKSVRQAAVPKPPKPPRGPLPVRGKAARILNEGAAAAPPPPPTRTPTQTRPRSSAEPVMRRETMHFGGSVRSMQSPENSEDSSKPKVLVADDDARIRMVFRIKLEEKGFTVMEASDGAEAWKMLQQGLHPDAVVLDMKMPGLHGLEVLQRISDKDMGLPVVICTAYDSLDDEFVVATYPKLRYLTKPVDADQLAETLFNLLAEA